MTRSVSLAQAPVTQDFRDFLEDIKAAPDIHPETKNRLRHALLAERRVAVVYIDHFFSEYTADDGERNVYGIVCPTLPDVVLDICDTMQDVVDTCRILGLDLESYLFHGIPSWAPHRLN